MVLTVVAGACIVAVLVAQARVLSRITTPGAGTGGAGNTPAPIAAPLAAAPAARDEPFEARDERFEARDEPVAAEDAGWAPVAPARPGPDPRWRSRVVAPTSGPMATVVEVLRRRPSVRRGVSIASLAAMAAAIGLLGYPFFTNIVQGRIQDRLERQFDGDRADGVYRDGEIEIGDGLVRISIPSLSVRVVVVEGTSSQALKAGAGHYENTALPCEPGNVGIAGHRTTYGRPFHDIDLLRAGHRIVLETPSQTCTYEVTRDPWITTPRDVGILASSGDSLLTLTTCHPKGSARQRLVVQARLIDVEGPSS
jgi:sortase A